MHRPSGRLRVLALQQIWMMGLEVGVLYRGVYTWEVEVGVAEGCCRRAVLTHTC
jgi:hypothetical protein